MSQLVLLRPHQLLLRNTLTVFLSFFVPTFAVLYWLTIERGTWLPVLICQLVVTVVYGLSMVSAYRVMIRIDETGITERGFFRAITTFALDRIGSVVVLDLYASGSLDTTRQLFITDKNGRLLIRIRGQFWSSDDMDAIVDELDAPIIRVPQPITLADLNTLRPELLYWFERRWSLNIRRRQGIATQSHPPTPAPGIQVIPS